jgi:serine/threonine protein kinase
MSWNEPLAGHPRYEFVRNLGRGSHSLVQLCRDRATGEAVAVKLIQRGEHATRQRPTPRIFSQPPHMRTGAFALVAAAHNAHLCPTTSAPARPPGATRPLFPLAAGRSTSRAGPVLPHRLGPRAV